MNANLFTINNRKMEERTETRFKLKVLTADFAERVNIYLEGESSGMPKLSALMYEIKQGAILHLWFSDPDLFSHKWRDLMKRFHLENPTFEYWEVDGFREGGHAYYWRGGAITRIQDDLDVYGYEEIKDTGGEPETTT